MTIPPPLVFQKPTSLNALNANAKEWATSEERYRILMNLLEYIDEFTGCLITFHHLIGLHTPISTSRITLNPQKIRCNFVNHRLGHYTSQHLWLCGMMSLYMTSLLYHPQLPGSLEDTPLTYVNSLEQLQELQEQLTSVKEFAVDLEVGNMVWCSSSPSLTPSYSLSPPPTFPPTTAPLLPLFPGVPLSDAGVHTGP